MFAFLSVVLMDDDYSGGFWENWANDAGVLGTEIPARWLAVLGVAVSAWGKYRKKADAARRVSEAPAPNSGWSLSDTYLARHWRGELPLAVAFWGSLFGSNLAYWLCIIYLSQPSITVQSPGWLLIRLVWTAMWIWAATGVWRSADKYTKRHRGKFWGHLASAFVFLQGISVAGQLIASI